MRFFMCLIKDFWVLPTWFHKSSFVKYSIWSYYNGGIGRYLTWVDNKNCGLYRVNWSPTPLRRKYKYNYARFYEASIEIDISLEMPNKGQLSVLSLDGF